MIEGEWTYALDAPRKKAGEAWRSLLLTCSYHSNNETPRATDHLADTVELASIVLITVFCDKHDGGSAVKDENNTEEDI